MTDATVKSNRLFTLGSGGWVLLLAAFFSLVAAGLVLWPIWETGFRRAVGDGVHVDSYGFDLSNLMVPKEKLVASGNAKDGIRVIPQSLVETASPAEVDLIAANEHIRFLVPSDRVVGLTIGGVSRAYPLRVLNLHELVNDTLGDVPLAVTFCPLCDSVVVFDRRIDGAAKPALEFGHSGLFIASNTVFYDRRAGAKGESLWPQLALKAISGPLAGNAMKLLPYELTTWGEWRKAHPDTRALLGLRTLKEEYGAEPYNVYLVSDDLRFPADPLWNVPGVRKKTLIVVRSSDLKQWTASFPDMPAASAAATGGGGGATAEIHTSVFAWYAQHPDDTDYSAIRAK